MTLEQYMTKNPIVCTPSTHIRDVARAMKDEDCGSIPVIEEGDGDYIIGMITDRDIVCRIVAEDKYPELETVNQAMSRNVVTVTKDDSLEHCRALMERHRVRRLPVVAENNRLVGIISAADIARHLPEQPVGKMFNEISRPMRPAPTAPKAAAARRSF